MTRPDEDSLDRIVEALGEDRAQAAAGTRGDLIEVRCPECGGRSHSYTGYLQDGATVADAEAWLRSQHKCGFNARVEGWGRPMTAPDPLTAAFIAASDAITDVLRVLDEDRRAIGDRWEANCRLFATMNELDAIEALIARDAHDA